MNTKKTNTLTSQPSSTAIEVQGSNGAALDELAGIGDVSFENDGLNEIDREDMRIAARVFNMKGTDKTGDPIPANAFYDTVDETVSKRIDAVFLLLHKTNLYSVYDNAENRTEIVCRSFDRVTGTMNTGLQRPCEGCPDAAWYTDKDGKRRRNCASVYNLFAEDMATHMPFVIRFKKTSMPVIKSHLQKHHLGRRVVNGQRKNYPLFSFKVQLTAQMDESGKYALPVITRGDVLSLEEIKHHSVSAKFLSDNLTPLLERVETDSVKFDETAADTSFDPSKFSDDGKDFVDAATGAPAE